jgi:hypothetical protein
MASSYLNIITFLLTTFVYYLALKPNLKYDDMTNQDNYNNYLSNSKVYLAVYFFAILIVQFIVNTYIITQTCGGSVTENLSASGSYTFIPWSIIFGAVIVVLMVYPGLKSAFSDVVGYFYISDSANKLLTELLINTPTNDADNIETNATPNIPLEQNPNVRLVGGTTKKGIQEAADMTVKIFGNTSLLINQIVPSNFVDYWNTLQPLMKSQYQIEGSLADQKRNEFFDLVVKRDNIGEAMWYIYTGLLISAIVQLKIATRGCIVDPNQMAKNYQTYISDQEKIKKEQQQATSKVYTLTN